MPAVVAKPSDARSEHLFDYSIEHLRKQSVLLFVSIKLMAPFLLPLCCHAGIQQGQTQRAFDNTHTRTD